MTEQVLVSIKSLQVMEDGEAQEAPELITTGSYSFDNQVHQVVYEEQLSDSGEITTNWLTFSEGTVDLQREGEVQTHMLFEKGKKNLSFYETPYGSVSVEMTASEVEITCQEENIHILLDYDLTMNEEPVAGCTLNIDIRSQQAFAD